MFRRPVGASEKRPTHVVIDQPSRRADPTGKSRVDPGSVGVHTEIKVRRAVRRRRAYPIRAYIGANGHGKSVCAVLDMMPALERGRTVLSTTPLLDWRLNPADDPDYELDPEIGLYLHRDSGAQWQRPHHPNYRRLTQWSQILGADERTDVLLDDVAGVASSRQSSNMPSLIEKILQKLRHSDMTLAWTAPAWGRADIIIRECTQLVVIAKGSSPLKDKNSDREWLRNRRFEWTAYDAAEYTEWTEGKKEKAKRVCFQRYWGPGSDVFQAFDSLGAVDTITSVTDAGRCVDCGGTRTAPKCSCPSYVEAMAEAAERGAAGKRSASGDPRSSGRHARDGGGTTSGRSVTRVAFSPRGYGEAAR